MYKKIFIPAFTLVLLFSCFKNSEGLKQTDVPRLLNQYLMMHVEYHQIDDELSGRIFDNYINVLDYGKYFFKASDVSDLRKKYRGSMKELITKGQFDFVFDINNLYKKRFSESMNLFNSLIKNDYNFNVDEEIVIDREKVAFASDNNELKERWRKNIKLQLLNYISAGESMEKAKSKLVKKYKLIDKRAGEFTQDKILTQFVNAFSTALDPHSNYLSQDEHEDFKISMELKLEGIGARLRSEDGFVIIESIIPGGAADKLSKEIELKPSDKIVAVAQGSDEAVDVIDMDLRDVVQKIRGKKGTEVRLTIIRENGPAGKSLRLVIPIIREEVKLQDSEVQSEIFNLNRFGEIIKIGYVKLPSFYQDQTRGKSSAGDMLVHLSQLSKKGVSAIVVDLRGNPGGLLNEAVDIAGLFIETGPVVQIKSSSGSPHVLSDYNSEMTYGGPIVVLIDKFSASASEILAGAIKDYGRGIIVGPTSTFGKGTVQSYNPLPNKQGAMKVTTHIFYQPAGTSNQLYGVSPDIIIPDLTSIWDIGEDKTKYPLKWQKIPKSDYKLFNMAGMEMVSDLSAKSKFRVSSDKKFIELSEKIAKFKVQLAKKSISLKEESKLEKQREEELKKNINKEKSRKIMDVENDLFLGEVFNITGDYIKLIGK
jgi:carboxyl-terminal processing protease